MAVNDPNKIRITRLLGFFLKREFSTKISRCWDLLALVCSSHYSTSISMGAHVVGRSIRVGKRSKIEAGAYIGMMDEKSKTEYILIGENCEIRGASQIHSWNGFIEIGDNCSINANTILYGTGGIRIGKNVRIACNTAIVASAHNFSIKSVPISEQGISCRGITIEDDCWIGAGVTILDGISIGKGSIVGAGAVVTKNIAPFTISVGIPSKIIKNR